MNNSGKKSSQGFTLIELMVVIVVLGVLFGFAIPAFQDFMGRGRISGVSSDLSVDLAGARMEAIRRGSPVTICASQDQATCRASSPENWVDGWIVFSDKNSNGVVDAATDKIIKVKQATRNGVSIAATPVTAVPLTFRSTGELKQGMVAAPTFRICKKSYRGKDIKVSLGGMARTTSMTTACP